MDVQFQNEKMCGQLPNLEGMPHQTSRKNEGDKPLVPKKLQLCER